MLYHISEIRNSKYRMDRTGVAGRVPAGTGLIALALLATTCIADLRPPELRERLPAAADITRGRELLEAARKQAGYERYKSVETLRLVYRDEWRGAGEYFNWWPTTPQRVEAYFVTDSFTSKHRLLDGPAQGEVRGVQNWRGYRIVGDELRRDQHPEIMFYLPTLHYFLELPYRIDRAPQVVGGGTRQWNGETYDLVFVTWGDADLQLDAENDQYELWVARSTGRIEIAHYTVRETFDWLSQLVGWMGQAKGTIYYSDFRDVAGLEIPFRQLVTIEGPGELSAAELQANFFHRLTIEEASLESAGAGGTLPFKDAGAGGDYK